LEKEHEITEKLTQFLKDDLLETKVPRDRRVFVTINLAALKKTVGFLTNELGFKHISTISGSDLGKDLEVLYHFAQNGSIELSLRITVPESDHVIVPTITDLVPAATLYEREVHDLLGIVFEGHPDLSPLVLPEHWPQGVYPLRKEQKFEDLRKIGSK